MSDLIRRPREGEIYQPWDLLREECREKARLYYGKKLSDAAIIARIYGGKALAQRYSHIDLTVADGANRIVMFRIVNVDGEDILLPEISFRQLLVESSILPAAESNWDALATQQRLEICQSELARWSVQFSSDAFEAPVEIEQVELVNNCTTSEGFEIKVSIANDGLFHGSVILPQSIYKELSRTQAGAWARQGWEGENDHNLLRDDSLKRCFGHDVYCAEAHAEALVRLDLMTYRTRSESWVIAGFRPELGVIDYDGLAHRTGNREYVEKPRRRGLVATNIAETAVRRAPPATYVEAQQHPASFRLPDFGSEGMYKVFATVGKEHYWQLSQLNHARIWLLDRDKFELELERLAASGLELHRLLFGNLSLKRDLPVRTPHTVDRFGFNPRPTVTKYDPNWRPAREGKIDAPPYAWVLARGEHPDEGVFIQSESWGIERAVLYRPSRYRLTIDLISFERIVPVWRCELDLPRLGVQALEQ